MLQCARTQVQVRVCSLHALPAAAQGACSGQAVMHCAIAGLCMLWLRKHIGLTVSPDCIVVKCSCVGGVQCSCK